MQRKVLAAQRSTLWHERTYLDIARRPPLTRGIGAVRFFCIAGNQSPINCLNEAHKGFESTIRTG